MNNFFYVQGQFDLPLLQRFKAFLRQCDPLQEIVVRIRSEGGNIHVMNVLCALIFVAITKKRCRFIAEIEQAQSSALLLALQMQERRVCPSSIGMIHLPEQARGVPNPEQQQKKRESMIAAIGIRTSLHSQLIEKLNGLTLGPTEMLQYNIATHSVAAFENRS